MRLQPNRAQWRVIWAAYFAIAILVPDWPWFFARLGNYDGQGKWGFGMEDFRLPLLVLLAPALPLLLWRLREGAINWKPLIAVALLLSIPVGGFVLFARRAAEDMRLEARVFALLSNPDFQALPRVKQGAMLRPLAPSLLALDDVSLGWRVRRRFPGTYGDLSDGQLGAAMRRKILGQPPTSRDLPDPSPAAK